MVFFYLVAQRHEAVWICSALIALTAIYYGWRYRRGVTLVRRQLRTLMQAIDGLPSGATRDEILKAINESAITGTPLAKAFASWSRTFVRNFSESGPRYYSTVPPSHGLDLDGIAASTINFPSIHAIPNILIGMGLRLHVPWPYCRTHVRRAGSHGSRRGHCANFAEWASRRCYI